MAAATLDRITYCFVNTLKMTWQKLFNSLGTASAHTCSLRIYLLSGWLYVVCCVFYVCCVMLCEWVWASVHLGFSYKKAEAFSKTSRKVQRMPGKNMVFHFLFQFFFRGKFCFTATLSWEFTWRCDLCARGTGKYLVSGQCAVCFE